jgi:hypothetical protein
MSTQNQAMVTGAIAELKLELEPSRSGIVGGPSVFVVTKETLDFLKDKKVVVDSSGSVEVSDA